MLKYGNEEFRNLEEQVGKNKQDIERLETGVKIEKSLTVAQLSSYIVEENVGKYYLVTDNNKNYLELIVKNNAGTVIAKNLGEYPRAEQGPQGIPGVKGDKGDTGERGPQGIQGNDGIRGRTGAGWDSLTSIDTTPYTPTFTEQTNDVKVETSANLVTNGGTPAEESKVIDLKFEVPKGYAMSPVMNANTWRGKNLGTVVTDEQIAAIRGGTFKDLFIGDYWVINNRAWRIADMDYFYKVGDPKFLKHHLVMIPNDYLYIEVMNDTLTTNGGYAGSRMRASGLDRAKNIINSAFGSLVQTHKDFFTNAVTDGRPSGGAWFDSTVELMNEIMVYGCHIRAAMDTGAIVPTNYTTAKKQLSIFRLNPTLLNTERGFWLRDIVSSIFFAHVSYSGAASAQIANHNDTYVYPYFVIG